MIVFDAKTEKAMVRRRVLRFRRGGRRRSVVSSVGFAGVVAAVAILAGCLPGPPPPGSPSGVCRPDPFSAPVTVALDAFGAETHHLTVAVFDDRSGCWYEFRPGQRVSTASVVKIEIMAGMLLRAQQSQRDLTPLERQRVAVMIRNSDDRAASALWSGLGGGPGMARIGSTFGLDATDEVSPVWGLTTTTARDQAQFVEELVQGPSPLGVLYRDQAWRFLSDINPSQQWGVRSGVPDGWRVGHKNGFAGSKCCGWRVNSVGYVADPLGGGYSIAILSDRWPNLATGIPMVEAVARLVAVTLTAPQPEASTTTSAPEGSTSSAPPGSTTTTPTAPTTTVP